MKSTEVKRRVKNHMSLYHIKLRILPVSRIHVLICKLTDEKFEGKNKAPEEICGNPCDAAVFLG